MSRDDRLGVVEASLTKTDACKANASVIHHETISLSRPRHKTPARRALRKADPCEILSANQQQGTTFVVGLAWYHARFPSYSTKRGTARGRTLCRVRTLTWRPSVLGVECFMRCRLGGSCATLRVCLPGLDQVRGWDLRAFLFLVTTCCTSGQCHTSVYCSETSVTSLDHTRPCKLARSH